jgi:HK97 family phage major capsid protein
MDKFMELSEEQEKLVTAARALSDKAEAEKRDFTQEETNQYDKYFEDIASLKRRIEREKQLSGEETRMRTAIPTVAGRRDGTQPDANQAVAPTTGAVRIRPEWAQKRGIAFESEQTSAQKRASFRRYILGGPMALGDNERRDLQMDQDVQGGFLVPPQEFSAALIQAVDDSVFIRQWATVETVTQAESLGIASLDADPADADWTAEIATGSADTTMKFGKRELKPHPLAKRIKISNKLIRAAKLGVEAKVIERLSYKFGITAEKAYLLGTGAEQPLGVFVATSDGISTGRDVATGNSTTAIGADGLIEAKYKIKGNYWERLRWLFHRDALKSIMKLKDTNGQYLWVTAAVAAQRGLASDQPDTLIGAGVYLSEYVPNTFTTGKYVGIVGDFSKYGIVDALQMQFQRLIELYAETNQVGYIGRLETDGMPLLEEAFARVTLA